MSVALSRGINLWGGEVEDPALHMLTNAARNKKSCESMT